MSETVDTTEKTTHVVEEQEQESEVPLTSEAKGKGKAKVTEGSDSEDEDDEDDAEEEGEEPVWHTESAEGTTSNQSTAASTLKGPPKNGDWEAIWSAQYNAYYFHNSKTNVTTWENPITKPDAPASAPAAVTNPLKRTADHLDGIDPDLAYLDPSLSMSSGAPQSKFTATARFNARTGKFEADPEKNPDRVSDFNRAKRQNAFFFDVDGWEKQKAEENAKKMAAEAAGIQEAKQKKPTKAELEMYKARAHEKKMKKRAAWLAD